MRISLPVVLRACGLGVVLWLATADAAEPTSPLIGATRDQVLSRYGEPRSQMAAGDRLIFLYPRERIFFRGDVVIEVEQIVPEPVRRPSPAETPPQAVEEPAPVAPSAPTPGPASSPDVPATPPPPEPKLEIKLVRPPGSRDLRPPEPALPTAHSEPVAPETSLPPVPPAGVAESSRTEAAPAPGLPPSGPTALSEADEARKAAERAAALEKEQQAKAVKEARRRLHEAATTETSSGLMPNLTWVAAGAMLAVAVGFLYWRSRLRTVEIAAPTAATPTPGAGPAPLGKADAGCSFTADMLDELEWKRLESLVVAYYSKTGVVATPTDAGPEGAVHIKISWKGEPRPFAYVRCVSNSSGVVDVKPLVELSTVLATEDIRRGYVVTPGRFTPAARELAGEKQLTLLAGDVFLEKLNALPITARKELMRAIGVV